MYDLTTKCHMIMGSLILILIISYTPTYLRPPNIHFLTYICILGNGKVFVYYAWFLKLLAWCKILQQDYCRLLKTTEDLLKTTVDLL